VAAFYRHCILQYRRYIDTAFYNTQADNHTIVTFNKTHTIPDTPPAKCAAESRKIEAGSVKDAAAGV